jgi:hypothetical protein
VFCCSFFKVTGSNFAHNQWIPLMTPYCSMLRTVTIIIEIVIVPDLQPGLWECEWDHFLHKSPSSLDGRMEEETVIFVSASASYSSFVMSHDHCSLVILLLAQSTVSTSDGMLPIPLRMSTGHCTSAQARSYCQGAPQSILHLETLLCLLFGNLADEW